MPTDPETERRKSQLSAHLTERGRGRAERAVLGDSPRGTVVRIAVVVALFVLIAGSVFYALN